MKELESIENPVIIASFNLRSLNGQPKMVVFHTIHDLIAYGGRNHYDILNTQYQYVESHGFSTHEDEDSSDI